jgi:hypothetical protein
VQHFAHNGGVGVVELLRQVAHAVSNPLRFGVDVLHVVGGAGLGQFGTHLITLGTDDGQLLDQLGRVDGADCLDQPADFAVQLRGPLLQSV